MKAIIFFTFLGLTLLMSSFKNSAFIQNTDNIPLLNRAIYTDGKELTVQKACTLCHNPKKKIVGPSFKDISNVYKGDSKKLLDFLSGKSKPIVFPEEFQFMKPVLNQLKHATLEEKKEIVKYILSL